MTSYLFNGQWTTDKNDRKYRHMSVIPFPVCQYATINYKGGRQLKNVSNYVEGRQLRNKNEIKQNRKIKIRKNKVK